MPTLISTNMQIQDYCTSWSIQIHKSYVVFQKEYIYRKHGKEHDRIKLTQSWRGKLWDLCSMLFQARVMYMTTFSISDSILLRWILSFSSLVFPFHFLFVISFQLLGYLKFICAILWGSRYPRRIVWPSFLSDVICILQIMLRVNI